MKNGFIFGVIIAVAWGLPLPPQKSAPKDVYQDLRNMALRSSRTKLGLPRTSKPTDPWGVIMEWGLAQGTATIVAFSNGHASVYLSSGGGFIGGGESHESVRKAAKKMVSVAVECRPLGRATEVYPLPQRGEVKFYFLTDAGIFVASASEEALGSRRDALAKLGDAGQDVLSQYRLVK